MLNLGPVPANSTLYIPFDTFNSSGASVTISGLAVTDIEIYKNGSVTQRASDAGYALLDTDGIDFDGITGIHGFSVDLSDNTDAGFYAVGSWYWVVISSITVNTQTVNFVAAVFRIVAAESVAGKPKVDVDAVAGTAQTAGDIIADTNDIQARLPAALVGGRIDASVGAMAADVITPTAVKSLGRGTVDAGATTTSIPTSVFSPAGAVANQFAGRVILFDDDTSTTALRGQATSISASSNAAAPTFTVVALTTAPASGDLFSVI